MLPTVVDWEITSICNLTCPFCFGPQPAIFKGKELGFSELVEIAEKLAAAGVQKVVVTGGEASLRPDFVQILESIRSTGLQIVLSTNGFRLVAFIDKIAHLLDWIALPLDGADSKVSALMRSDPNHHDLTAMNLQLLERFDIQVKVGTVICQYNYKVLDNIADLLSRYKFDTWKLYEFSPRDRGFHNRNLLTLPPGMFNHITGKISTQYPNMKILVSPQMTRNRAYFLILPDGTVITPNDSNYMVIGSMFDDYDLTIRTWRDYISESQLAHNYNSTYPADLTD